MGALAPGERFAGVGRAVSTVALCSLLTACDQGSPELSVSAGPPLRIVSSFPERGGGLECAADDVACGIPRNPTFELRFDRFLRPDSAIRQAVSVYTGAPSNVVPASSRLPEITPEYDVVERVVRFSLPEGFLLHENAVYTLELAVPDERSDFGFKAFDGAPLAPETPLIMSFGTSNQIERRPPAVEAPTCDDIVKLFSGCSSTSCHGGETPRMGLDLSSGEAIRRTAIGRVAHQTEVGDTTGVALEDPARMGVAMPIIDPYRPDNSYLLYKILIAPDDGTRDACVSEYRAPVDPERCTRASEEELARLRDAFVRGEPMPHPATDRSLGDEGVRTIKRFIRAGAACP